MISPNHSTAPDSLLGWMEGLGDPTRLRIMRVLERQELGVVELCEVLRLPQSTVSRHLKVLSDQGWLENRRHGTASLYRTAPSIDPTARRLWRLVHEKTEDWATARQDALRLETRLRVRRRETESFFSGAAADWERTRVELYGKLFGRDALLALLPPDWTIADLGCGIGDLTAAIAPRAKKVIGVDQSAAMLKAARRRVAGFPNVDLRRGELEAIPIESAACDAALLVLALTYVVGVREVLSEVSRILKPEGRLVIVDLSLHDDQEFLRRMGQARLGFAPGDLAAFLSEAGFADVRVEMLAPDPAAKGPALLLATAGRSTSPKT